jgi:hypothetical protein
VWYNIIKERQVIKMRKPRLNENTIAKLEIYGQAESGKNYYQLIDYIDEAGHCCTKLERTDLKTGDIQTFNWKEQ